MSAFSKLLTVLVLSAGLVAFSGKAMAISSSFVALLYGGNVIAPNKTANAGKVDGYGMAMLNFVGKSTLCYSVFVSFIDTPKLVVIRNGRPGSNGTLVARLNARPTNGTAGISSACVRINSTTAEKIRSKPAEYYIEVVTSKYPRGALRGQLL